MELIELIARRPWKPGKTADSVVTESLEDAGYRLLLSDGHLRRHGGFVIAHSVAPKNLPLICAVPEMLELLSRLSRAGQEPLSLEAARLLERLNVQCLTARSNH